MRIDDEPLELTEDLIEQDEPEFTEGDDGQDEAAESPEEVVIAFSDEDEDEAEATPLVKKLREQIRERDRKLSQMRRSPTPVANADPEPLVPDRPRTLADFDYDEDRFTAAMDAHLEAKEKYGEWRQREERRKEERTAQEAERARQIEQQRKGLGVRDYDARAALVRDRLSDEQLSFLIEKTDNPARIICALGGSETRLDALAAETDMASFLFKLGQASTKIKETKKMAPAPESRVRGATAPMAIGGDKQLERLEKEATRTGDRSKLIAYRQSLKNRAA